jgi:hypothetical protein
MAAASAMQRSKAAKFVPFQFHGIRANFSNQNTNKKWVIGNQNFESERHLAQI